MALITRVRPQAGDTAIRDLVTSSDYTGSGTITLVDVGAEKAWRLQSGSLYTLATAIKNVDGFTDGSGVTIAARFRANSLGTNSFMPFAGVGSTSQGARLMRAGGSFRGRILSSQCEVTTSGVTISGNIVTIVYKIITSTSTTDSGALWVGGLARTGVAPNFAGGGVNLSASNNIQNNFLNVSDSAEYDLLDYAYFDEELSDANCAALADDIVGYFGAPAVTTIAFTGTIPNFNFTAGEAVSEDLSTYFSGTETPFVITSIGESLSGIGLSIASGFLVGTVTEGSVTGAQLRGTDAALNTADSNSFNVTVNAAAQVPQGTVTIGTITKTETTASVPYTYSLADQTGFEYRLNGGTAIADAASPVDLTGLTAGTPYTIEVRSINATGSGSWSAVSNFTTDAIANPTIVFSATNNLSYNTGTLRESETGFTVDVHNPVDGSFIDRFTSVATNASGYLNNLSSINLPAATEVRITVLATDGAECVFRETTQ